MGLEAFRWFHTGDVAAVFAGDDLVPAAFHHHAAQAHSHTVNRLIRLSGDALDGVANDAIGIVECGRTIESLVALLYQVALSESEADLRSESNRLHRDRKVDALQKWSLIASWFSNGTDTAPSEVTGRITELRDFRNSFEHWSRGAAWRRHSRLADPAQANEFDLMEALAIALSGFEFLRHVIPDNDLMPQVVVPTSDSFFFEKLDTLAASVLIPMYSDALSAMHLEPDIFLYDAPRPLRGSALAPVWACGRDPRRAPNARFVRDAATA